MRQTDCARKCDTDARTRRSGTSRAGFTIIELLVTMVIIGIIATFSIVSLNNTKVANEVDAQAAWIESIVREIQNLSLTGKGIEGTLACSAYMIEAGADGSSIQVTYFDRSTGTCIEVPEKLVYPLGNDVSVAGSGDITFLLPHGIIHTGGAELGTVPGVGSIRLTVTKGAHAASVCVYPLGRIEHIFDNVCP